MTKKELHLTVIKAIAALNLGEAVTGKVNGVINEYLTPRSGGASVNLDEVTKKNDEGVIVQLQCSASKVWLPATLEFFYEDKAENAKIVGAEGKGLKRLSRQAEYISKKFNKTQKASIQAITDDIIALDMSVPENIAEGKELKKELEKVKAQRVDFSDVSAEPAPKEA